MFAAGYGYFTIVTAKGCGYLKKGVDGNTTRKVPDLSALGPGQSTVLGVLYCTIYSTGRSTVGVGVLVLLWHQDLFLVDKTADSHIHTKCPK